MQSYFKLKNCILIPVKITLLFFISIDCAFAQYPEKERELIKVDELIDQFNKKNSESKDTLHDKNAQLPLTRKEKKEKKIKEGKMLIAPYIAPVYSPELEYALSGGALVSFSTKPSDTILKRSSVPIAFTVSSNGSFMFTSYWTTFFSHNNLLMTGILQYRDLSDHYYGVGYEKGLNTVFPDSTKYKRILWQIYAKPLWKVKGPLYLGAIADFNYTEAYNVNEYMARDEDYVNDGAINRNTGFGIAASYDTRDFPQNAYSGAMFTLSFTSYGMTFGGENRYQVLDLEYRKYFSLSNNKEGRILALYFHGRHSFDDVPYGELSYSGSSFDIRGYRTLRFRDRVCNNFVAEYRHKFHGSSFMSQRSGFVVWAAMGSIGPVTGESFFVNRLPNIGIGYRFEVEHRLNVRMDIGFGKDSNGVYFDFQEAY